MRIVLGVSGGIAAYKAVLALRLLTEAGHRVRVIPTAAALEFVGAATWEALSGEPVSTSVFDGTDTVDHVRLGREADLMIVAPATADLISRARTGRADDLLTATLLTVDCPVLFAPAMHTEMWRHGATVDNVRTLRARGVHVLEPADGRLTGSDSGPGRLPEPDQIVAAALALIGPDADSAQRGTGTRQQHTAALAGLRVVISAGGTREPLDPVRFLGNRSSGRQGVALAARAAQLGGQVTLVAANVESGLLDGLGGSVQVEPVGSAEELLEAMTASAAVADVLIMAAAVADFRPAKAHTAKIKKHTADSGEDAAAVPEPIKLVANPDILAALVQSRRPGQVIIGFAAETGDDGGDVLAHGRAKARRKGADLLAVNQVGTDAGFGDVPNAVVILDAQGTEVARAAGTKDDVATGVMAAVADRISHRTSPGADEPDRT